MPQLITIVSVACVTASMSLALAQSSGSAKGSDAEPPRPSVTVEDLKGMIRSVLPAASSPTPAAAPTPRTNQTCPCCGQPVAASQQKPTTDAAPGAAREVVIICLHGEFEENGLCDSISPMSIDLLLSLAEERKPAAIVLDIDSPGGLVPVKELLIDRLLKLQTEQRIPAIAWPGLAGSAAALTCMSCKDIIARPTTVMGAATRIHGDGNAVAAGETALDKKIESVEQARRRQIAQITGRDLAIMDAMQYPEKLLWYSKSGGFRTSECAGCIAIDTSNTLPATLNASELISTGIAKGTAATISELLPLAGLPTNSPITRIDLCDPKLQAKLAPIQAGLQR